MRGARRLVAAMTLVCVVSAACDATVPPPEMSPSATPPTTARPTRAPVATTDPLRPDPNAATVYPLDARAPGRLAGTTHDLDIVIQEKYANLADGVVRQVWAYGATVPGPVIRVGLCDTIRIRLDNTPPRLPHMGFHRPVNDHHHSIAVPWSGVIATAATTSIAPGEQQVYEFTAERPGVWLYRCVTDPALQHLASGEYGMIIVEPAGGLEPVREEFFLVQGEWYAGPPNRSASLAKAAAAAPDPDFVVFNGIADQYVSHPIQVASNTRIRVFVLDAGPNFGSWFGIDGADVNRVIRDGVEVEPGSDLGEAGRTVELGIGQGAIVEFTLPADGLYPFLDRATGIAGRGAIGLFRAGDGDPLH